MSGELSSLRRNPSLQSTTSTQSESSSSVDLKKGSLRLNSSSAAKTLKQIKSGTLSGGDSSVSSLYTERVRALSQADRLGKTTSQEMVSLLKLDAAMKGDEPEAALKSSILPSTLDFAVKSASSVFVKSEMRQSYSDGINLLKSLHQTAKKNESALDSLMGHIFSNKTSKGGLEADKGHYIGKCDGREVEVKLALAFIDMANGREVSEDTQQFLKSKGVYGELEEKGKSFEDVLAQNPNLKNLFDRTESFLKLKLNEIGSIRELIKGGYLDSVYALKDSKIAVRTDRPNHLQTLVDAHNKLSALRDPVVWDDSQLRAQLDYANSKLEGLAKDAFALKGEMKKAFSSLKADLSPTQIRDKFNTPQKGAILVKALDQRLKYLEEFLKDSPTSSKESTRKEIAIIIGNMMRSATTRDLLTNKHLQFFESNTDSYIEFLNDRVKEAVDKGGPVSRVILSYARELHEISGPDDKQFLELTAERSATKGAEPMVDLQKALVLLQNPTDSKIKAENENLFSKSLIAILKNPELLAALKEDVHLSMSFKDHFFNLANQEQSVGHSKELMKQILNSKVDPRILLNLVGKEVFYKSIAADILLAAKFILETPVERSALNKIFNKDSNKFIKDVRNELLKDIESNLKVDITEVKPSTEVIYHLSRGIQSISEMTGPVPTIQNIAAFPNLRKSEIYGALMKYREDNPQYQELVARHGQVEITKLIERFQFEGPPPTTQDLELAGLKILNESDQKILEQIVKQEGPVNKSFRAMFEYVETLQGHMVDTISNLRSLEATIKTIDDTPNKAIKYLSEDRKVKNLSNSEKKAILIKNRENAKELVAIYKLYLSESQKVMNVVLSGISEKLDGLRDKPISSDEAKNLFVQLANNMVEVYKPENLTGVFFAQAANFASKADLNTSLYSSIRENELKKANEELKTELFPKEKINQSLNLKALTQDRQRILRLMIRDMEKIRGTDSKFIPFAGEVQKALDLTQPDQIGKISASTDAGLGVNELKRALE